MRGRFFLSTAQRWFQPQESTDLLEVSGDTVSLDRFYDKYVAEPRRYAAIDDGMPHKALRDNLCLSALLTGWVEVIPAKASSYASKRLRIDRILSIEVLEVDTRDCLRWRSIE
jgi:hypothetical protein